MYELTRGFSRQHRITEFPTTGMHQVSALVIGGFAYRSAYTLTPVQPLTGPATFLRHPIAWLLPDQVPRIPTTRSEDRLDGSGRLVSLIHHGRAYTGTGISTRCPSTTPVGLALGPDSPWAD